MAGKNPRYKFLRYVTAGVKVLNRDPIFLSPERGFTGRGGNRNTNFFGVSRAGVKVLIR